MAHAAMRSSTRGPLRAVLYTRSSSPNAADDDDEEDELEAFMAGIEVHGLVVCLQCCNSFLARYLLVRTHPHAVFGAHSLSFTHPGDARNKSKKITQTWGRARSQKLTCTRTKMTRIRSLRLDAFAALHVNNIHVPGNVLMCRLMRLAAALPVGACAVLCCAVLC